jgi:hypothetical protein
VDRPVVGWRQDEERQWVAELACGHSVHVRHDPPWQVRPWVVTETGRAERLGALFPCVKCDAADPDDPEPNP